ncbi:MAG: prepilin peptidase [Pirellulales bacterium]
MATVLPYSASLDAPLYDSRLSSWRIFSLLPAAGLCWAFYAQQSAPAATVWQTWTGFIILATLLAATATDLARHRIPNYITYPAVGWLLSLGMLQVSLKAFGTISDAAGTAMSVGAAKWTLLLGAPPIAEQWAGFGACFVLMFFIFMNAGGGGGDVKIAAVLGAGLGPTVGLTAIVAAHIAAGAFALAYGIVKFGPKTVLSSLGRKIGHFFVPLWVLPPDVEEKKLLSLPVPLAPFFLIGALYAVAQA